MKIRYMTEVNGFEKFFGGPGPSFVHIRSSFLVFNKVVRSVVFGVVCSSSDLNPCHARKGHASPAGATVGTQIRMSDLSTIFKFC
jgi:hypothetical protein